MRHEIEDALNEIEYAEVKDVLLSYASKGRSFALPIYQNQNHQKIEHRKSDLLGGIPYTNERYPWPTCGEPSIHMQPIIQINLRNASKLLKFDYGDGLLQLWGIVCPKEEELDVAKIAFDKNKSKGILVRLIPEGELMHAPSDFFPDYSPWLDVTDSNKHLDRQTFFKQNASTGSGLVIDWALSDQLMYPVPCLSDDDTNELVMQAAEESEELDDLDIFDELKSSVVSLLRTPNDGVDCYLGGVRGYSDGRYADLAQGFPVLMHLENEIAISVIFDENVRIQSERIDAGEISVIHFPREDKLRVVYACIE